MTRRQLVLTAAVCAAFAAFATWRSSLPGVNEPHYLCKARHFWDPAWCARDQFLTSANAHWVFYATVGSLTRVFSFDQAAWIGRMIVWGGLAFAWVRLSSRLLGERWLPLLAALFTLAILAPGSMAGEWLVGGVESKGFAYAALLVALDAACSQKWREAAIAAGVSISFHPIVGGWGVVALGAAHLTGRASQTRLDLQDGPGSPSYALRVWRGILVPGLLCLVCSLPGLIPAVALLANSPSPAEARAADVIQVFDRLDHHLDPKKFRLVGYALDAVLLVLWMVLRRSCDRTDSERFFARFVTATLAIAALGLIVGFGWRLPGLMKFYPFRLSDVFLPIAVSVSATEIVARVAANSGGAVKNAIARLACPVLAVIAIVWCTVAPGRNENASNYKSENWREFLDACRWIEQKTAADSLFLTPRHNVGFKWYAQRAEYVTWKDCPQDAAGILEWKARLDLIVRWRERDDRFSKVALAELNRDTGIDYVLDWTAYRYRVQPVYRNRMFAVYPVIHRARE